jgi:hypothetical protein
MLSEFSLNEFNKFLTRPKFFSDLKRRVFSPLTFISYSLSLNKFVKELENIFVKDPG